jgi:cell division transport system permease protein
MFLEFLMFWTRETISNIGRNRLMSLLAITTVTVGLFILGSFFLVLANVRTTVAEETHKLDIVVFLKADITPERRKQIYEATRIPQVRDLQIVTKAQALKEVQRKWPDIPMADFAADNPLSDELRIKLKNPEEIFAVQQYLSSLDGVLKTRRDDEPVRQLLAINRFLTVAGLVSLVIMGMACLLIIHNAIRLTIFARRREIRIMELVGATAWFIRVPFLLEGIIYGIVGAVVAAAIIGGVWLAAVRTPSPLVGLLLPLANSGVLQECLALMLGAGLLFGLLGSWVSLSRSMGKAAHV